MPIMAASSTSVAGRPSSVSAAAIVFSSLLALVRTRRGTQSLARSLSRIAPRTRHEQKVLNLTPRPRSKLLIASIIPNNPADIRSSMSTLWGRFMATRSAV